MMYSDVPSASTKSAKAGGKATDYNSSSVADKNNVNTFDKLKSSVAGFFDGFN